MKSLHYPYFRHRLLCPGPTATPDFVLQAGSPDRYHRTAAFYADFLELRRRLQSLLGADDLPVLLASSGTGAMEAAMLNFTEPGQEILVIDGGKFGERWLKLGQSFGLKVHVLTVAWGQAPDAQAVMAAIKENPGISGLYLQSGETSTGTYYQPETLIPEIRKSWGGPVVVDAISTLLAHPLQQRDWGIDIVIGSSQKAFGCHAGLSFVSVAKRLWQQQSRRPRFYFDLAREYAGQAEGRSSFTPASSLVLEMLAAAGAVEAAGLENVQALHQTYSAAVRAAGSAMGLGLIPTRQPHFGLSVFRLPEMINGSELVKRIKSRYNITVAGGQDQYKDRVLRFGHLGFNDPFDVAAGVQAVELSLQALGHRCQTGAAAVAYWEFFSEVGEAAK